MKNIKNVFGGVYFVSSAIILIPSLFVFTCQYAYSAQETYTKSVSKDIPFSNSSTSGQTKKSPGMLSISAPVAGNENAIPAGPESFASDDAGNVYICDTLGHGIQVYSPRGVFLKNIQLDPAIVPADIAVDKAGNIYIFDDVDGMIYQYDASGVLLSNLKFDLTRIEGARGPLHIAGARLYVSDDQQRDVLIGKVVNTVLAPLTKEELSAPLVPGINAPSGRRYYVELQNYDIGSVKIINSAGIVTKEVSIPAQKLLSIAFLKEDKNGNFYVQTERSAGGKVLLEMYKFDSGGNYLAKINFTDTDYSFWSIKLMSVDDNENVYQFVPTQQKAILNIFRK